MALDTSPKIPVIRHCMLSVEESLGLKTDFIVDLDATAPLRDLDTLKESELVQESAVTNVITGSLVNRHILIWLNWLVMVVQLIQHYPKSCSKEITRRQDAPGCFDIDASIYAWKRESLLSMDTLFGVGTRLCKKHLKLQHLTWTQKSIWKLSKH